MLDLIFILLLNNLTAIVILVFVAFIPGNIAAGKGRSWGLWWFYGLTLPPIAIIHSLAISKARRCPYCDELIREEAIICKHCHKEIQRAS
jgi:hypothetical protein